MPYGKYRRYGRRPARRTTYNNNRYVTKKAATSIARREIRKDDKKDHPLEWIDVKWTGDYVKTTPSLLSLSEAVKNAIASQGSYAEWPVRRDSTAGTYYRQGNIFITGINYQFRFQQNESAADVTANTARCLIYSFNDTYPENGTAILNGGDVDQPPRTQDVSRMMMDRLFTMVATTTEITTDDSQFVPGYKIIKGWKKLYHKFELYEEGTNVTVKEGGDIRVEFQSDDNSAIGEIEVYGFIRVYYRLMG